MPADKRDAVIDALEQTQPLREPVLRQAIAALGLPPGSHGLDVGCGIGQPALLLAAATAPGGQVTGLDTSAALLDYARTKIAASTYPGHVSLLEGDMRSLPFNDNVFDWAWSVDCAGYPAGDLLPVLTEMARVVRPGGIVALLGWSSQQILPGYPLLEARLNASCSAYAPWLEGKPPATHLARALHWFAQAGITNAACRTFVGNIQGPLAPEIRTALRALLTMLWTVEPSALSPADRKEYRRLCSPASPDFILDLPDYCGFFTYTMYWGVVEKA